MDSKKLWPSVIAVLGILANTFADPIMAWVAAHPQAATNMSAILAIVANLLRSPREVKSPDGEA